MKHCIGMRRGSLRREYYEFPQPIPVDTVVSNGALKAALVSALVCLAVYLGLFLLIRVL